MDFGNLEVFVGGGRDGELLRGDVDGIGAGADRRGWFGSNSDGGEDEG
jgi:hypothetical protein